MKKPRGGISAIYPALIGPKTGIPEFINKVAAGFPSPADDYMDRKLDLNDYLIKHPAATFYVRVKGDSMSGAGIDSGDLLLIDRAVDARSGSIVMAVVNGEFTIKRLLINSGRYMLVPENDNYETIEIKEGMQFEVWGVVKNIIKEVK